MLHHITEEHRAEIRLEYLHFLRPTLGTHYLRESTFLTIISKGRSHHCLAFFAILICLNTLKTQIFLKTQRILTIFIWPSTQSGSHLLGEHLGSATRDEDMLAIVLIHSEHKEFPTLHQLYLVKNI